MADHSLLTMVSGSGPVVQGVLILLVVLSLWSWGLTFAKWIQFSKAKKESGEFQDLFWDSRNLARIDDSSRKLVSSPLVEIFRSGYRELRCVIDESKEQATNPDSDIMSVEQALRRAEIEQAERLERGNTFLATVASAAPFIGLFGTVWGIMNAFQGLSTTTSTTLQAVAPGISEALVATAIGLAAAIPASVAYNYFAVGTRNFRRTMEKFSDDFLNVSRRYLVQ